jgi:hypothetical protein
MWCMPFFCDFFFRESGFLFFVVGQNKITK